MPVDAGERKEKRKMSEVKIVCLGRLGTELETAAVYVLDADECVITYIGQYRFVFWSRSGNFKTPDQERKEKAKGGERFIRCKSLVEDPCEVCDNLLDADRRAQEIRQQLEADGELAVEAPTI